MVLQVNEVLVKHGLNARVIAFVKDVGGNFSTMTQVLASIVSCEKLGVRHIHLWIHFGGMLCVKLVNMPLMIIAYFLMHLLQ